MPTETLMMKDSKIDWLGIIPKDWDIVKFKYISRLKTGGTPENNEGIDTEDTGTGWYTPGDIIEDSINLKKPLQYITPEIVKRNRIKLYPGKSVLFVGIASIGKIGYIEKESYSNQQITALIPNNNIYGKFLAYSILAESAYIKDNALYTVVAIVNNQSLGNYKIALPDITEQQAIADFLDEKCGKIDKVTSAIEEQIQVLEDYKKSLITETVTKGLDKNVSMKDSGIDWIGNIPENWEVKKIKYIIQNNSDGIKVGPFGSSLTDAVVGNEDGEYKIYGQANLIRRDFNYGDNFVTEKNYKQLKNYEVLPNDICVSMMGTIGKCCVVPQNIQKGIMDSHLIKIRLSDEECPKYFEYCYESDMGFEQLLYYSKGSIMNGLNSVIVKNIYMPFPELNTQKEIAGYLDKECKKIDTTISDKKEQLETIKEYKKSLIYEYVTGKKRVAC